VLIGLHFAKADSLMRGARSLFIIVPMALALSGCFRSTQQYMVYDPNTGQSYMTTSPPVQQAYGYPQQQGFELYGQGGYQASAQQSYAQQTPAASKKTPQQVTQDDIPNRGLFTSRRSSASYAAPALQPATQQGYVVQYGAGSYAQQPQQTYAAPAQTYAAPAPTYAAAPRYAARAQAAPTYSYPQNYGYASASPYQPSYTLDAGDKLRVVVFGQEGLTNSYVVDAGGNINMPLVGTLPARGVTTQQLASLISTRLKQGYVREPHVSVEIETYRPFFILGEVNTPGQYPYVANMTAEAAVAIAGGFSPRADKKKVELTRNAPGQQVHGQVPLNYPLRPGDTIVVKERWF
jgi:polysaccharide export outer membrane protein